jgi:outer membrane protein assembly factor BamB
MSKVMEVIGNVVYFSAGKYLIYKDKQKNVYCNNNRIYEKVDDDLIQHADNLFFNFGNNLKIINLINNSINTIQNILIINVSPMFIEKSILIDNNNNLYLFDKLTFSRTKLFFKDYDWGYIYVYICTVFISTKREVISYSLNKYSTLWQFDLQTIPNNPHDDNYRKEKDWEINKFIGVAENKLWVALNHHTIIALDVETGRLLHQIHDIPDFRCEWLPSAIPLSEATMFDEKENKLIGFMWEFYWEINPADGAITLWDLTTELLPQKLRSDLSHFVLTDGHIYFASHNDSKLGALNRNTKKIDWQYAFEKDEKGLEPRIMNIQGNDKMLGALSSKGNLYLFEKE